jgi:acetyltransferase
MPHEAQVVAKVGHTTSWRGHALLIRPVVPGDEVRHADFFAHLQADDLRLRFFNVRRNVPHAEMIRLVHPDEATEVALIALVGGPNGEPEEVGTARAVSDADNLEAEFGITVRSDLKGLGVGRLLLAELIARVRQRGTRRIACEVLRENAPMRALASALGFHIEPRAPGRGPMRYVLDLR